MDSFRTQLPLYSEKLLRLSPQKMQLPMRKNLRVIIPTLLLSLLLLTHLVRTPVNQSLSWPQTANTGRGGKVVPATFTPGKGWSDIPNTVFYVYIVKDEKTRFNFRFADFLSIYSAQLYLKPEALYLYTDASPEVIEEAKLSDNFWNKAVFGMPGLEVRPVEAPYRANNGKELNDIHHRSDFARLNISAEIGGVYLDFDVFPICDFAPLRTMGYANVFGAEPPGTVNSGIYMSIPQSRIIKLWLRYSHRIYDGGWVTHSVKLITNICRRLAIIPKELLVLDTHAFSPYFTWQEPGAEAMFGSKAGRPVPISAERPEWNARLTTDDVDRLFTSGHASLDPSVWDQDLGWTFAIHAYKNTRFPSTYEFTPGFVLARESKFAWAVYPAVKHALDIGMIPAEMV